MTEVPVLWASRIGGWTYTFQFDHLSSLSIDDKFIIQRRAAGAGPFVLTIDRSVFEVDGERVTAEEAVQIFETWKDDQT